MISIFDLTHILIVKSKFDQSNLITLKISDIVSQRILLELF